MPNSIDNFIGKVEMVIDNFTIILSSNSYANVSNTQFIKKDVSTFKENEFYDKIREVAIKNIDSGEDVSLTQKQMIDICVVLNGKKVKEEKVEEKVLTSYIMGTKYGTIFSK